MTIEYYENTEWGHGTRPLMGRVLNNKQHGGLYAHYSVERPENKLWSSSSNLGYHHITVHNPDHEQVGRLEWNSETGEILNVDVAQDYRRQGVATSLFHMAHSLSKQYGVPAPVHSEDRSEAGDAWAQKVGGELPPRKTLQDYQRMWGK